jgi:copper transport protein
MHADSLPDVVMVTARLATFASQALLFGLALILVFVARPAFVAAGSPNPEARIRVSRRLARTLWISLIVTVLGTGVVLYDQMLVVAESMRVDLSVDVASDTLGTRVGQWLVFRIPLVVALTVALLGRVREWALADTVDRESRPPARWWVGWVVLSLALLATLSLSGHAAGTNQPPFAIPNDVAHLAAGAIWLAGIVLLVFILPAAWRRADSEAQLGLLAPAVDRFAPIALGCIMVVAATGLLNSLLHLAALHDLTGSGYGRTLTVKVCGFICVVGLGAINHFVLRSRLLRARARHQPTSAQRIIRRTVATEAVLATVILAATSILVSLPPTRR